MSHLPTDRLAALVDEAPSVDESAHLAACEACTRELAAYRGLGELAAAAPIRLGAPITTWESLRPVLAADGVIDDGRGLHFRAKRLPRPWLQAAAAVLLVAGGVVAGRYSAGAALVPSAAPTAVASTGTNGTAAALASDSLPAFRSIEEARAAQARSQQLYQTATAFLAQRDTSAHAAETAEAMRTRLAALDQASQVMGAALSEAPYDPVINGYYLTTLGQREATLRQINTTLPASMRVVSY